MEQVSDVELRTTVNYLSFVICYASDNLRSPPSFRISLRRCHPSLGNFPCINFSVLRPFEDASELHCNLNKKYFSKHRINVIATVRNHCAIVFTSSSSAGSSASENANRSTASDRERHHSELKSPVVYSIWTYARNGAFSYKASRASPKLN